MSNSKIKYNVNHLRDYLLSVLHYSLAELDEISLRTADMYEELYAKHPEQAKALGQDVFFDILQSEICKTSEDGTLGEFLEWLKSNPPDSEDNERLKEM